VAVDLSGDGKPDLVVVAQLDYSVSVLVNQGNGTFAAPVSFPVGFAPTSVAALDLNGDGRLDLAVSNDTKTVTVLLNTCLP
jgi:hypothetical protein